MSDERFKELETRVRHLEEALEGPRAREAEEQGPTIHLLHAGQFLCGFVWKTDTQDEWFTKDEWGPTIQSAIDGHHTPAVPHIDRFCPKCRKAYNENML